MPRKLPSKIIVEHVAWQRQLVTYFLRHAFRATVLVTVLRMMSELAQVFALLIPLKIIMMLSSNGIPRALRWIVTQETRDVWLVSLTIATVVMYVLSIVLDLIANKQSNTGVEKILSVSEINVSEEKDQRKVVKLYTNLCSIYAYLFVFFMFTMIIALVLPSLFLFVFLVILVQILITDFVFKYDNGFLGWLHYAIIRNKRIYIKYLSAMGFMLVFLALVLTIMYVQQIELIFAILAILLTRRSFSAFSTCVNTAIRVNEKYRDDDIVLQMISTSRSHQR